MRIGERREVQHDDGVGRLESYVEDIVGSEIAIEDSGVLLDKLLLTSLPLVGSHPGEIRVPEHGVQFDDGELCHCTQAPGEG